VTVNPSTSESVSVYSSNDTDLILDITGYFAPASLAPSGLSLYTLSPCRVIDTRESRGEFQGKLTVPFTTGNNCSIPTNAQAYVLNATVVPSGSLDFLTLWPDGIPQPLVSTLNAGDGSVTSNMAIVNSTNGSIDAFASSGTQLILDVAGYFASPPGPTVVILGDSTVNAWLTPQVLAQHPGWVNQGTPAGVTQETTAEVLAREPQALALKPDILILVAGTWDMADDSTTPGAIGESSTICQAPGTGEPPAPPGPPDPCQNISSMVNAAITAGVYVIVGTIPPSDQGILIQSSTDAFNWTLATTYGPENSAQEPNTPQPGIGFTDFYGALMGIQTEAWVMAGAGSTSNFVCQDYPFQPPCVMFVYEPVFTTDGVNPNAAGGQVMTQAVETAIAASKLGTALRRNPGVAPAIQSEHVRVDR
jgi:hypothetical protein